VPRVAVGGGVAGWSIDGDTAIIIPTYVSTTPVGRNHSPYIAAGVTFGVSNISLFSESRSYSAGKVGTISFGYQFRSSSGFVIRPTTNFIYDRSSHIWWPGVTIAHSF
jgi:hypothetical protein